jgi:glycosyltransferase involved in cell wall biosynthesis
MSSGITAHMVVKNEDQWVWFAISSVLPYVDSILITDTGSTDRTVDIIKAVASDKIIFNQVKATTKDDVTAVRQAQIENTKTSWIWIVDGDEIYGSDTAKEIVQAASADKYSAIVVRRYDLLGDIYHRQIESVGSYNMFGQSGHLLIRLLNKEVLKGLSVKGQYPLESYYTGSGKCVNDLGKDDVYITTGYLYHAMYLKRSSLGSNLSIFNRNKYKVETGIDIGTVGVDPRVDPSIPPVFYLPRPTSVPDPLVRRGLGYDLVAGIVTPLKNIKRRLSK